MQGYIGARQIYQRAWSPRRRVVQLLTRASEPGPHLNPQSKQLEPQLEEAALV